MLPGENASSGRTTHPHSNMSRSNNIPRTPFVSRQSNPSNDHPRQTNLRSYRLSSNTPSQSNPINTRLKHQQKQPKQNLYNGGDPFSAPAASFTNLSNSTLSKQEEQNFVTKPNLSSEKPPLNTSRFEPISSTGRNSYSVHVSGAEVASKALKSLGPLNNEVGYLPPNANPRSRPIPSSSWNNPRNLTTTPSSPACRDSYISSSHPIPHGERSYPRQSPLVMRRNNLAIPNSIVPINVDEDNSTANHDPKPALRALALNNTFIKAKSSANRPETSGGTINSERSDPDEVKLVNAPSRQLEVTLKKQPNGFDEPCDIDSIPIPRKETNTNGRAKSPDMFYLKERSRNISIAKPSREAKETSETQIVLVDERDPGDEQMNTKRSSSRTGTKQNDQSVSKSLEKSDLKETNVNNVDRNDTHTIDLSGASPDSKRSRPFSRSQFGSASSYKQNTNSNCTTQAKGKMGANETVLASSTGRRRTMKEGRTDRIRSSEPQVKRPTLRSQVVEEKIAAASQLKRQRTNLNLRLCNLDKSKENESERKKFCDTKDWERIVFNEKYFDKVVSEFITNHPTLIALPFFGLTNQEVRGLFEKLSKLVQADGVKQLDLNNNRIYNLSKDIYQRITALKVFSWNMSCNRISNIPDGINLCCTLRILNISRNNISSISQEIGELCNLEVLNLAHNQLTTLPEKLYRLQKLEILNLSHNDLRELPEDIACEGSILTSLDLSFNVSFEKFPKCAGHWKHIVDLLLVETHCFSTLSRKELRLGEQKLLQNLVQRASPSADDPDSIDVQYVPVK